MVFESTILRKSFLISFQKNPHFHIRRLKKNPYIVAEKNKNIVILIFKLLNFNKL